MSKIVTAQQYFREKKRIQIIAQTTIACNLRCRHCYEAECNYHYGVMADDVLERIIKLSLESYGDVSFLWFGGEPLMAGLGFFEKVVYFQSIYKQEKQNIENSVQTNAILIDQKYIDFFVKNDFHISISLDGQYNDFLRTNTDETLRGALLCEKAGLHLGFLSVIHSNNYKYMYEMYSYFKEKGWRAKFNRIYGEGAAKQNSSFLIQCEEYNSAFIDFFEKWLYDPTADKFSSFEIVLSSLYGTGNRECVYSGCLFSWLSFTPSGDAYNCPRFMGSKYLFGNIMDVNTINDLFYSPIYGELAKKAIERRKKCSSVCNLFRFCQGGCNAQCFNGNGLEEPSSDLCSFAKTIFPYISKRMFELLNSDDINFLNGYMKQYLTSNKDRIISTYNYIFG